MNTHTTEQLLMCEKGDLVKYIEELREQKEGAFTEGYEEAEESLCVDKEYLDEKEDEIKKLKEGQKRATQLYMDQVREYEKKVENIKWFKDEIKKTMDTGNNSCIIILDQIKDIVEGNEKLKKQVELSEGIVDKFSIYCDILDENADAWEDMINDSQDYMRNDEGTIVSR